MDLLVTESVFITIFVDDVMTSIAPMKMSETIEIPKNKYIRNMKYTTVRKALFNKMTPGSKMKLPNVMKT